MNFDESVRAAWQVHHEDLLAGLRHVESALRLVETAEHAQAFSRVAVHVVGEEAGDWPRSTALCRGALDRLGGAPAPLASLCDLAVAQAMAGDGLAALAAESRAIEQEPAHLALILVRTRLGLASALARQDEWDASCVLSRAALAVWRQHADAAIDRVVAASANNLASALLEDPAEAVGRACDLEALALAAKDAWGRIGDWTNSERADYLLAMTYRTLGRHSEARACAERGLVTIRANGMEGVDAAFLQLELAHAARALGDEGTAHAAEAAALSLRASPAFEDAGLQRWFDARLDVSRRR